MSTPHVIHPFTVGDDQRQAALHGPATWKVPAGDVKEVRRVIMRAANLGVTEHGRMVYSEGANRWSGIVNACRSIKGQVPPACDCSSFATWCYWDATRWLNLQDIVNGERWQAGYTGTMVGHGRPIPVRDAALGDLIFYGSVSLPYHVAIFAGTGMVVSMGRQGAPELVGIGGATQCRTYL